MEQMVCDQENVELAESTSVKCNLHNNFAIQFANTKLIDGKALCCQKCMLKDQLKYIFVSISDIVMSQESHPIQNWPPGIHQSALEFLSTKPDENKKEKTKEIINVFYQDLKAKLIETIDQSHNQSLRDLENCEFGNNDLLCFYNDRFKTKDLKQIFTNINEFNNEKYQQLLNEINQNKEADLKELYKRIEKQKNCENQIRFAQPHQIKIIASKLIQNISFFCPPTLNSCESSTSDGQETSASNGYASNESEQQDISGGSGSDGYQSPSINQNLSSFQSSSNSNLNIQSNQNIQQNKQMWQSQKNIPSNQKNSRNQMNISNFSFPSNKQQPLPIKRSNFKSNTFAQIGDLTFNGCSPVDITVSNIADIITKNLNKYSNLKFTIMRNINALQTSLATHSSNIDRYIQQANSNNQGMVQNKEEQILFAIQQIEQNIQSLSCLISEDGLFCNIKQDCLRKIIQEFKSLDQQEIDFLANYTNQKEYSHLSNNYLQDLITLLHSIKDKFSNITFQKSNRHSSQQFDLGRNIQGNWQFSNNYIESEGQILSEQNLLKETTYIIRFKFNYPFYKMNEIAIGLINEQNIDESLFYSQLCISNKSGDFIESIQGQNLQESKDKENINEIEMRVNLDKGVIQFSDYPSYQNVLQNTKEIDSTSQYRIAIYFSGQNNKIVTLTHYQEQKDWIPFN